MHICVCVYLSVCVHTHTHFIYTHAHTYTRTRYSILGKIYIYNLQDFLLVNNESIKNDQQWHQYSPNKKLEWLKGANNR